MYKEILMIMDTCHAMSLYDAVKTPNLFLVGSSNHDENAFSYQFDKDLSTNLNDKFSYYFHEFINGRMSNAKFTKDTRLSQFSEIFSFDLLDSHLEI
jgi:phosphatidylinositol glycan class K